MSNPRIQELLKGDFRYERENIAELVDHLANQLRNGEYDLDANLAILKLYLLYPEETDLVVIERILLKALMAFPDTDFSLCMYQIPEKYHKDLKDIRSLAQQLEMAKFSKFWQDAENYDALKQASGWEAKVQNFIAGVIGNTYRSIGSTQLMSLLHISSKKDLDELIKARGWTRSKEHKEIIIVNTASFESARVEVKEHDTMSLDQYKTLFMASSVA